MRHGPSPYALAVIRVLLAAPATVPDIERRTDLDLRTVRAQITALRQAGAVRKIAHTAAGSERRRYWALYQLPLQEIT